MNILLQIGIVFIITWLGEVVSTVFVLPLPGNVLGMIFLLLFLYFKWVKEDYISDVSNFISKNMAFFFIPSGVSIIENLPLLEGQILKILFVTIATTIITLIVTGITAQAVMVLQNNLKKKER